MRGLVAVAVAAEAVFWVLPWVEDVCWWVVSWALFSLLQITECWCMYELYECVIWYR